jgi:CPA1 family monovalent cation:H+ antiporter
VAVVVFITILKLAKSGADLNIGSILMLFGQEAIGGVLLGLLIGYIGYKLIASTDNYQIEGLITLAIVTGCYTLSHYIHISGPLAMVAAELITGNHGKSLGMSDVTAEYVDKFWELIDEVLNAILFVLIGLELLVIQTNQKILFAALIILVVTLITRNVSI